MEEKKEKKSKQARMGKNNRSKGHSAERLYVNIFKELGFEYCVTARYGSRMHDDAGIDLINLPFNIQVKAGHQRGMKPERELTNIKEKLEALFPPNSPEALKPSLVIHRRHVGPGNKRTDQDDMVHMTFKDFSELIKKIQWD